MSFSVALRYASSGSRINVCIVVITGLFIPDKKSKNVIACFSPKKAEFMLKTYDIGIGSIYIIRSKVVIIELVSI